MSRLNSPDGKAGRILTPNTAWFMGAANGICVQILDGFAFSHQSSKFIRFFSLPPAILHYKETLLINWGVSLKCRNWSMLTTLIHANYCLLSLFITWRMSPQRPPKGPAPSGEASWLSLSLFHKGSHWIRFHFFFFLFPSPFCLTWQLWACSALSEKPIGNVYLLGQISGKRRVYHFKGL